VRGHFGASACRRWMGVSGPQLRERALNPDTSERGFEMATTAVQQGGTVQPYRGGSGYVARSSSSGLYDVLELILDKGLVIDVFVRVSLVGIEILTIDARIVIASVDTYLRFAEAVSRLDLMQTETQRLPGVMDEIKGG